MANELAKRELNKANAFSMIPQNYEDAMRICKMIASSDLTPKDYKGKPENVFIAGSIGFDLGISLMQAMANIAVINGRGAIYGDLGKALLVKGGCKIRMPDLEEVAKLNKATVIIERDGVTSKQTFTVDMAKKAGLWGKPGPWTNYPERQLSWRAFWFAARDIGSDLLKGVLGAEEAIDIDPDKVVDITPEPTIQMPKRILSGSSPRHEEEVRQTPAAEASPMMPPEPILNESEPEPQVEPEPEPEFEEPPKAPRTDRSGMRKLNARFKNKCNDCGVTIEVGEECYYDSPNKKLYHIGDCNYVPE